MSEAPIGIDVGIDFRSSKNLETPNEVVKKPDFGNFRKESEISSEVITYHDVDIKVIKSEHADINIGGKEYPELNVYLPSDWENRIDKEIGNPDIIFLEYFIPDLERSGFAEPVVGIAVKSWAKEHNIDGFTNPIARMAGRRGCDIAVADTASSSLYMIQEVKGEYEWGKIMEKTPFDARRRYDGSETQPDNFDFEVANAIDSRRLMTARSLMGEAIRLSQDKEKGKTDRKTIVCITPEAHASRILAYIQRQKDAETLPGVSVEKPEDLLVVGQKVDIERAEKYKKTFGLNTNTRYYSPTLSPERYTLDEMIQREEYGQAIGYLEKNESTVYNKILLNILNKVNNNLANVDNSKTNPTEVILKKLVSTNKSWARTGVKRTV